MYERMLNKQVLPTVEEMREYCAENAEYFSRINDWLTTTFHTEQKWFSHMGTNMVGE